MITFHPLASGSGANAYLIKSEECAPILCDAGLGYQALQRRLWAEGTSATQLACCLISHGHMDHCQAAAKLMAAGVDCYASLITSEGLVGRVPHRAPILTPMPLNPQVIGPWRVMPFAVPHDEPGILGFMIEDPAGDRLVYATDLCYAPDRFEGVNVLCLEANFSEEIMRQNAMSGAISTDRFKRTTSSHMSIERLLVLLGSNDLSRCRAIYLMHGSAMNSDSQDFKRQVQRATGIPTYVCREHGGVEADREIEGKAGQHGESL